jgi:hypothetical protein
MLSAAALTAALGSVVACGPPAKVPTVSMRMTGEPQQARVIIDEAYIGGLAFVASRGVALPVGSHRITVEAPGYFPQDQVVTVEEGDPPVKLDVHLTRIPD